MRLLFNLWEDRRTGTFYEFGPSGEPIEVASVTERGVGAQRSLVRRYQAAKQMHLALFIDSTNLAADLPEGQESWERADDSVVLHYYRDGERGGLGGPFSRLFGKRIIPPPPVEDSLLPPFDRDRGYETFVIGVDANGKEVTYTSDPRGSGTGHPARGGGTIEQWLSQPRARARSAGGYELEAVAA